MTSDRFNDIDLSPALEALFRLELAEGDLGRAYWRQISELLRESASFRQRALVSEDQLRRIQLKGRRSNITGVSKKEIGRISTEYPRDVARMQKVLLLAGKEYPIDDVIRAWIEYSEQTKKVWGSLSASDDELLLKLLGSIDL
ncbi:hypothetical protein I5R65_22220 [Herbaspirillum sp. AP02]|uniref:hypothetical protein n=1 Tax=unclassified Herbaspirillum TaxID=2624150 RepID=UPI0015DB4355|nr:MULTISPECIES: hypothetical protein [unclassified Herbaspirillum]MBG7622199.1 hypothetical protein [Herbaspirillum sp. AP02]NZD70429.1 hypothetical protein [Herbaspirillum sp. AP21]